MPVKVPTAIIVPIAASWSAVANASKTSAVLRIFPMVNICCREREFTVVLVEVEG
jgi:hypothetical protein